jgi:pyruvate ferredoxin oxidoreductase gamma subunit
MFQVRFHGRGGQGVVTAAELLAEAAFREARHAQALPSFGSERMGAPVMSFCRIDDKPIRTHEPVSEPRRSAAAGRFPSTRRRRVSGCWW